jgi:CheY-like chemotaxis protein
LWRKRASDTEKKRGMEARRAAEVEEGVTRVLVVDDSPVDRRVAQLLLSSNSCAGSFHGQHSTYSLHSSSPLLPLLLPLVAVSDSG